MFYSATSYKTIYKTRLILSDPWGKIQIKIEVNIQQQNELLHVNAIDALLIIRGIEAHIENNDHE